MNTVNRAALFVMPKQPYREWASSISDGLSLTTEDIEGSIYLLPEYGYEDEIEEFLLGCYVQIFELELAGWDARESAWPQDRTYECFRDWFEVTVTSVVIDLVEDQPLLQEDDEDDDLRAL